jgi:hypothetical protein
MSGNDASAFGIIIQRQLKAAPVMPDCCAWIGGQGTEP